MRTRTMMIAWMGSALVVGAALVWVTGPAAAVGAAPPAPRAAPLIASATVSADQATLTLTGLNFAAAATEGADGAPPSVSLALTPLPVTASSPTAVTATLPSPLEAGSYLLLLSRGDDQAAAFHVTIGAVGPPGPAGSESEGGDGGAIWQ